VSAIPYLPWIWLLGLALAWLRLAVGFVLAGRLYRPRPAKVVPALEAMCQLLARSLGITRPVTVGVCDRIDSPIVLGVLRPRILLPRAQMRGLGRKQIKLVLLHELAHIRRRDLLVNLVQRIIEAPLFFNPAAWLVSDWVRLEREHCCDRMVVERTGAVRSYAQVLLAFAPPRRAFGNVAAMGEPHLTRRVKRIVEVNLLLRPTRVGLAAAAAAVLMSLLPAGVAPAASSACLESIPATAPRPIPIWFEIERRREWAAEIGIARQELIERLAITEVQLAHGAVTVKDATRAVAENTRLRHQLQRLSDYRKTILDDVESTEAYLIRIEAASASDDFRFDDRALERAKQTVQELMQAAQSAGQSEPRLDRPDPGPGAKDKTL
jgi:hypothetical protein